MFILPMQHLYYSLVMLLIGLGLVTLIDIIGSIISRKFRFNYSYFAVLSFIAYVTMAYLVAEETDKALLTLAVSMFIGFYDGTIGWLIAKKLKANYKYSKEIAERITMAHTVFSANLFSILCGCVGYYLGIR